MPRKDANEPSHEMPVVKLRDGSHFEFRRNPADRMPPEMVFAEPVRQAIRNSDLSEYALAKVAGVPQQVISDFILGKNPRLKTFSRIAHWMGFELRFVPSAAPRKVE